MTLPEQASGSARQAAQSTTLARGARLGLVARGLVYIVIGVLAARIALGDSEQADQQGALRKIAEQRFGTLVLWLLVVGFAAYGSWRLGEAGWGRREESDPKKRTLKRIESLGSGLFNLLFCAIALRFVLGGDGDNGGGQRSITARLLDAPGGKELLVLLGLVIVGVGLALAWRGLQTDFEQQLNCSSMTATTYSVVRRLGQAGYLARGLVFALAGALVIKAVRDSDPDQARGLDAALGSVAAAPYGRVLLLAAAAGLVCFGAYSVAESRYRRL